MIKNFIGIFRSLPKAINYRSIKMQSSQSFRLSCCQLLVGKSKEDNIIAASKAIDKSMEQSSSILVLPECWNSPYSTASFPKYAETVPNVGESPNMKDSPSMYMLYEKAKFHSTWIVGGSVPERDGTSLYNTCVVFNPSGEIVAKHRKLHLFDIDVPGKITFKESDSLTAGQTPTFFQTPWGNIGIGICYDIRFPEYAALLRKKGADILIYPGAFNMITGPAHWELLQRARAVDNQVYVVTCSPARDDSSKGYIAWGHSTIVTPWGEVLQKASPYKEIISADIQLPAIQEMRDSIPCWKQKRHDLYEIIEK